jgi:hypothetical protein
VKSSLVSKIVFSPLLFHAYEDVRGRLTGIQLVADISATSPHHFLVFCHILVNFWRKIKVDIDLESGESRASI